MESTLGQNGEVSSALVELQHMDDSTREFLNALEDRVKLQLKPLDIRQTEILTELRQMRETSQHLTTQVQLHDLRITENKNDINSGLKAVRLEFAEKLKERDRITTAVVATIGIIITLVNVALHFL